MIPEAAQRPAFGATSRTVRRALVGLGMLSATLLGVACSLSWDYPATDGADGSSSVGPSDDDDDGGDSADGGAAAACELSKPFSKIDAVPGLDGDIDGVALTSDELRAIIRVRGDSGTEAFAELTRTTRQDAFVLAQTFSGPGVYHPTLSANGLTLGFTNGLIIGVRKRTAFDASFGPTVTTLTAPTTTSFNTPYLATDGLWLAKYSNSTSASTLAFSAVDVADNYGAVSHVQVQSPSLPPPTDTSPVVTTDGLTLYWSSARPVGDASATYRIWTAHRASRLAAFDDFQPVPLPSVGVALVRPTWISPDHCRLYIVQTSGSSPRIAVATR